MYVCMYKMTTDVYITSHHIDDDSCNYISGGEGGREGGARAASKNEGVVMMDGHHVRTITHIHKWRGFVVGPATHPAVDL